MEINYTIKDAFEVIWEKKDYSIENGGSTS